MGQSRASATSNANSKVLRVGMVVEARGRDSIDQMNAIAAIVDEWRTGVRPVYARAPMRPGVATAMPRHAGRSCSCDGPRHPYSPGWCPDSGPVTHG